MSRTLQFKRYNSATIANTTGANGELIINTTNHTITVHDGVTPGGFATLNSQTDNNIDQFARNTANTATSDITIIKGVNTTQNTRLDNIETVNNNQATAINVIQGVDNTQNIIITSVSSVSQSAYDKANAAYNYANTIVSDTQIDPYARNTANAAVDLAQNAYNNSNTKFSSSGGQITGNVIIVGDLDVTDNTVVTNAVEANNIIIDGTLKTGLAARTSVVLPHLIAQFASNSATYVQTNSQNINPEGSADWVVTADNGNDTEFYIDMGLHGSQAYDGIITPYDGYLYVQGSTIGQPGGNLIIGTTSSFPGLETMFVSGGYQFQNNIVMRIGDYGANVIGDMTVTERAMLTKITEKFSGLNDATGVVVHDCSTGHIFNHSSIDNNFTANFTNLNLNSGQATTITLVLNQGATAYIANSVQIGGVAQTIKWSANTVPTGNTNAVDVQSFSILNSSGTYTVLGQLSTFG